MGADEPAVAQECVEGYVFCRAPTRVLILRRPPERGRIWAPVSGKVDPGDRDYAEALRRELVEETGFAAPTRLFPLDWEVSFAGPDGRRWRLHAFGVELPGPDPPVLSAEHDAFEWVSSDQAIERLHYEDNREAVRRLVDRLASERAPDPPTVYRAPPVDRRE